MSRAAFTNCRKFELFNTSGGHGGPYHSLFSVLRTAVKRLRATKSDVGYVVRDRAKLQGEAGYNVAVIERNGFTIDIHVIDPTSQRDGVARSAYGVNLRGGRMAKYRQP